MRLRCLRIRIDCTNGGDWSVTFDPKVLGNGIHLFYVWKRNDRLIKCYIMCILIWNLLGAKWFIKLFLLVMKYTNRCSVGEGHDQSARVHRLVKAFVDQVSDIKNVHSPQSQRTSRTYRGLFDQSNFNWIWLIGVYFRHPSLNHVNDSQIKDYPAAHFN